MAPGRPAAGGRTGDAGGVMGTEADGRRRMRGAGGRWLAVALALMAGLALRPAEAQENFQLTHTVDRSDPEQLRVSGTVQNRARVEVVDVYVTADALDGAGKRVGRGIAFVASSIPPGVTVPFSASIPAGRTATGVRVRVSSFRFGVTAAPTPSRPGGESP